MQADFYLFVRLTQSTKFTLQNRYGYFLLYFLFLCRVLSVSLRTSNLSKREQAGLEGAGQDASEVKAKLRDTQAKQRSPNPEQITIAQSRPTYSGSLQKLNFADSVKESDRKSIYKVLSVLPAAQRELAETQISRVSVSSDKTGSYYNPFTKEIVVSESRKAGDVIHEYGHALERACKVWKDPEYISIRADGIDLADLSKVVYDKTTFTTPIKRLDSKKFISAYQGRLYDNVGILILCALQGFVML